LVKLEQEEVSAQQQQRLQQIDQRSAKQDDLVSAIDEGVTRLAAIALAMGDEVGAYAHTSGSMCPVSPPCFLCFEPLKKEHASEEGRGRRIETHFSQPSLFRILTV